MIGLVMAGGRGSRMRSVGEKLLLNYKKPVIMHVIDALYNSACFEKIHAITSPNSPKTHHYLKENNIEILQTKGQGYSKDLNQILQQIHDHVLVVSGDLPYLDGSIICQMVAKYDLSKTWTSFVVTREFFESLGFKSDFLVSHQGHDCIYTGISLINAKNITNDDAVRQNYIILDDKKIAFNLNTAQDYKLLGTA